MSTAARIDRPRVSHRTQFVTAGIVAGLAVMATLLLVFAVLSGGPAGTPDQPTAMPPATPVVEADEDDTATTVQDAASPVVPVVTYEVFLSRDPFEPVVPDDTPEPVSDPTDPTDPTAPTDPSDPTSPTSPTDPSNGGATPVSPTDPRCSNGAEVVCEGRVLTAVDIFRGDDGELVAVIQVDTTEFEVRRGQEFSSNPVFRVLDITATTVTLQSGDAAFTLTAGDTVLK